MEAFYVGFGITLENVTGTAVLSNEDRVPSSDYVHFLEY